MKGKDIAMALVVRGKKVTLKAIHRYAYMTWCDQRDTFKFHLEASKKNKQTETFHNCKSVLDYFHLSTDIFGLTQKIPEITGFLEYISEIKPAHVCEIGTLYGGTNFLLSQAVPTVKTIIGVDLMVRNLAKLKYFKRPDQQSHYVNGSSYAPQTVEKVRAILGDRKLDVLFIDGDHTYDGVKQDFLLYRHFVRENGIIAFHDIVPDYMTRYGKQTTLWAGDVPVFWQKVKALYSSREFIEDPEQDGYGIGTIVYDSKVEPDGKL